MKMRAMVFLIVMVSLPGCAATNQSKHGESARMTLLQIDAIWSKRGEGGLAESEKALTSASRLFPNHPGVFWRLARVSMAKGLSSSSGESRRVHFSEARRLSESCLMQQSSFAGQRSQYGIERALQSMDAGYELCMEWLAFAWLRWSGEVGASASAVDIQDIRALLNRTSASRSDTDLHAWSEALYYSIWMEHKDLVVAAEQFHQALGEEENNLSAYLDYLDLVVAPSGDDPEEEALIQDLLEQKPRYDEDRTAQQQIRIRYQK